MTARGSGHRTRLAVTRVQPDAGLTGAPVSSMSTLLPWRETVTLLVSPGFAEKRRYCDSLAPEPTTPAWPAAGRRALTASAVSEAERILCIADDLTRRLR